MWIQNGSNYSTTPGTSSSSNTITGLSAGSYEVIVTDGFGCTATAITTIVTNPDSINPIANCQDITVNLDADGQVSIDPLDIDNGSTDNCTINSFNLDVTQFDCSNIGTNTVTLTVEDGAGNIDSCTATVTVEDNIAPDIICQDTTVQLDANGNASITWQDVTQIGSYVVDQSGIFDPIDISSTGNNVNLGDDQMSSALPIGFNFSFYGNSYSNFYISSNGFITFSSGQSSGCCSGQNIPAPNNPNNLIAIAWNDLYPPGNGTLKYETIGTAPNRILIVDFTNVPFWGGSAPQVTSQLKLFEGTNIIEIHNTDVSGSPMTQGIENIDGTEALAVPERNSTSWAATNDFVGFTPSTPDNCSNITYSLNQTDFSCNDLGTQTVTVTATDAGGNSSNCTATVTVEDNIPPLVNCTAPFTIYLDANGQATIDTSVINDGSTDNCGIDSMTIDITNFDCSMIGDHTITLTVEDASGNTDICTTTVTVVNNLPPTFTVPTNINEECEGIITYPYPSVTSNCQTYTITQEEGLASGSSFPEGVTTNSFRFTEDSGTTAIYDFNHLMSGLPLHGQDNWMVTGNVSANNATVENFTGSGDYLGSNGLRVADLGGGHNLYMSRINDNNFSLPQITENDIIEITFDITRNYWGNYVAFGYDDNSDGHISDNEITFGLFDRGNSGLVELYGPGKTIIATSSKNIGTWSRWKITIDLAANNGSASISASHRDLTNSGNYISPASLQNVIGNFSFSSTGNDNPGNINGMLYRQEAGGSSQLDNIHFTVKKSDIESFTVTVEDNTGPTPDQAPLLPIVNQCEVLATDVTAPTATDNCGGTVTVTHDANFPITTQGTTVITWTYEDENGNTSTQTQDIIINDVSGPTPDANNLTDITAECEVLATDVTTPTATDNCGGNVTVTHDANFPITTQGTTVITWTYEDENGNTSTQTQDIVIDDVSSPTPDANNLADITAECEVLATDVTAPTATDNCGGNVTVTHNANFPITTQGITVITWTYEDENGNTSTQTQNIIIHDVSSPTPDANNLADITAECEVLATDVTTPTATDNCGGTVTVTNDANFPITTQGATVITWTYEDENGNTSIQTQNVVIDDVTAPVADNPTLADITAECEVLATDVTAPTATDNCGGNITVTHDANFPITTQGTTVITWTYEDENGNTSTQTQNVVIDDVTAPVADNVTIADITAECEVLATDVTQPTATDNCGGTVTVTHDADFPITTQGTTVITWTYEDENGNTSTQTQNIIINDVSSPTPDANNLTNITAECEVLATDITQPTATDNCGGNVTVTHDANFPITTQGTTVITWTYEDENGNTSTQTQNINVLASPIANVTLDDATVTYNGNVHTISVNNLPTDANVDYSISPSTGTPNGATDAGTYTVTAIVTPPASAVNCDLITLTATLTVQQATQTINFDALPIVYLEDDPDFQLQATASSGLPVDYTYTYTAANPPATVSSAGWVSLLTSGTVEITAHQAGNSNYLPATPVTQTLQINSHDASAHTVRIEEETYDTPNNEIYYLIDCNEDLDQVEITFETETNAYVNPEHSFTMETPAPGIYRQEVVITSQDGSTTRTYRIIVEKMFPFFDIVEQKFDNVLLVNNNPNNNGGYKFVAYEWFKDNLFIGGDQYYSAGPTTSDLLDTEADYYVRMETEGGDVLQTCIGNITLVHDFSASIYPNPNVSGNVLNVEIDNYHITASNPLDIQLFSLQGAVVKQWKTSTNISSVKLPDHIASGVYIVSCKAGKNIRNFKLIIE